MSSYYSQQEKTYPYFARCIYSGNEKIYDVHKKNLRRRAASVTIARNGDRIELSLLKSLGK